MNTPDMIFVKPTSTETKVINPITDLPISDEGELVARTKYWLRRIDDGSVAIATPKTDKK